MCHPVQCISITVLEQIKKLHRKSLLILLWQITTQIICRGTTLVCLCCPLLHKQVSLSAQEEGSNREAEEGVLAFPTAIRSTAPPWAERAPTSNGATTGEDLGYAVRWQRCLNSHVSRVRLLVHGLVKFQSAVA